MTNPSATPFSHPSFLTPQPATRKASILQRCVVRRTSYCFWVKTYATIEKLSLRCSHNPHPAIRKASISQRCGLRRTASLAAVFRQLVTPTTGRTQNQERGLLRTTYEIQFMACAVSRNYPTRCSHISQYCVPQ